MSPESEKDLTDKVRSLLKAENIDDQDADSALKSLDECALRTKCKFVYIKHIYGGRTKNVGGPNEQ